MDYDVLVKYIEAGYSAATIAKLEKVPRTTVTYWLKKYWLKTKAKSGPPRLKERKCVVCGKELEKPYIKFCDECRSKHALNGVPYKPFEELSHPASIRSALFRERPHQCEKCRLTEWADEPITLEVHHIDGDADNNTRENLQLLCPNCHSKTESYRTKNIGKSSRRSLYRK